MSEITKSPSDNTRVIADIGGTNARFAFLEYNGVIRNELVLDTSDYTDFVSVYQAFLKCTGNPEVKEAAIAIACPVDGDVIKMTNLDWTFSINKACQTLALDRLIFKNDFAALALSIPVLDRSSFHKICGGKNKAEAPIGVLGAGTGLGVSGLIYSRDSWIPLAGEGGHVSLSPTTKRDCQILDNLWQKYTHVSAERLLSGPGLKIIYQSLCQLDRVEAEPGISAQDITQRAIHQSNPQCEETLQIFCRLLGVVAGNLALTLGAKGGIYIGGGIVPKLGSYFENSAFVESFVAKGRFSEYLRQIPVYVIKAENPALIGISQAFKDD